VIYVREAHPADGWQMPSNVRDDVVHAAPRNVDERAQLAQTCMSKLSVEIPALIDDFEDTTDEAYMGWPDRLYLIDRDGRIAYKSNPGPFGFKPEELKAALAAARG
jgi:type I thyroxine 5'-deiodinase